MKRRSGTSSSQPEPTFFTDRNLGRYTFPALLQSQGVRVEIHDDHFAPDEEDTVWIPEVADRGWVILTADKRLRYVSLETEALMTAGARTFLFVSKTNVERFAEAFAKAHNRIDKLLSSTRGAFIAKIYADGKVKMWLTEKEWKDRKAGSP